MLTTKPTPWKTKLIALAALACMSTLIACSHERPTLFYTGLEYITLHQGQTYTATRDMVLATEAVIQDKDRQIIDLVKVNSELQRRLDDVLSR